MKIRSKLAWTFIILLFFGITSISSYAILFIRDYMLDRGRVELEQDTRWLSVTISNLPENASFHDHFTDAAETSGYELALYDSAGSLITTYPDTLNYDSYLPDDTQEILTSREDIPWIPRDEESEKLISYIHLPQSINPARFIRVSQYKDQVYAPIKTIRWIIYYGMFISIGLVIIVSIWMARYLTKPITQIKDAAQNIAEGDVDQQIDINRNDEFGTLAEQQNVNMSRLCRRFGISRPTGYKWLDRYRAEGFDGLVERSRRPHSSPNKTPEHIEELVEDARDNDRGWGGRKLYHHLRRQANAGELDVEAAQIPAPSTITAILDRNGELEPKQASARQGPWQRFERPAPNALWQMDFKGEFKLDTGEWCYPLTIVDDHSRFAVATRACSNQRRGTVKGCLQAVFGRYGLPKQILCDNGAPWGSPVRFPDGRPHYTKLAAWLMRLDIGVSYSRPGHPQSKGKNERFNGTLDGELLRFERFADQSEARDRMADWRVRYNTVRPHEALDMAPPASRYQPSPVELPEQLPAVEYGPDDATRKVSAKGIISFRGQTFRVGKAFEGHRVAVRASANTNEHKIYFCNQHIRTIILN